MTHHTSQHYIFYLLLIHARFTVVQKLVQELIPYYFPIVHKYLQEYGNYL